MRKIIELTNMPLFENLSMATVGDRFIDLHNDYGFKKLEYDTVEKKLIILFEHLETKNISVQAFFEDAEIVKIAMSQPMTDVVIDNMYRGRGEENGILFEEKNGKSYFYIDFLDDIGFELMASRAFLCMDGNNF
jgi:hypothetical protein